MQTLKQQARERGITEMALIRQAFEDGCQNLSDVARYWRVSRRMISYYCQRDGYTPVSQTVTRLEKRQ